MLGNIGTFEKIYASIRARLIQSEIIKSGRWQSTDVGHIDALDTPEIITPMIVMPIPETMEQLQTEVSPNLPWAEDHFQERVGGKPTNPGDTYYRWPWYKGGVENHKGEGRDGKFSHTYQERMWPKYVGRPEGYPGNRRFEDAPVSVTRGIRYNYGDLNDVVELMTREPLTRQAYLPIWFPEDTGVVHGERVPCSIGYQFLIRAGRMHVVYMIRSCDFVRYFRDDIYMAARLGQWMRAQVQEVRDDWMGGLKMGTVTMLVGSMHCFRGDLPKLQKDHEAYVSQYSSTN